MSGRRSARPAPPAPTGWGAVLIVVALPTLPAAVFLAVWLAQPDPASRGQGTGVRMVRHTDVMPCRDTTGGVCDPNTDWVYMPPTGPIRGDGG